MWTINPCTNGLCADGMIYGACEEPCEHDRLCGTCNGYGWIAERMRPIDAFIVSPEDIYRRKGEAVAVIESGAYS